MARKRMIDPNFWTDEKVGMCDPLARMTFMGLISQADDQGRLNGHLALIKSQVFPYDSGITHEHVSEWLKQLESKGLIQWYEVDGQSYITLPNFLKHQTINRPSKSKLPGPEEAEPKENSDSASLHEDSVSDHPQDSEGSLPIEKKLTEEKRKENKRTEKETANDRWMDDSCSKSEDVIRKVETISSSVVV